MIRSTTRPDHSPAPHAARIAVVGAGPGGLVAARILQRRGLEVTVYDSDPGPDSRDQGGSLDLRVEDGQRALAEAGLLDRFFELARPEGQQMRQLDPFDGHVVVDLVPEPDEREKPEIDRAQLRTLLLDSVEDGTVRWGHRLDAVSTTSPGARTRTLRFTNGSTAECDLVVGADGAFSRVRRAVSEAEPHYTGVLFLEAWFDDVTRRHPWLDELVGGGAASSGDGRRGMFAQRSSGGHVRTYVMLGEPEDWLTRHGLTAGDTDGVRAALLNHFAGWHESLTRMLTDNDGPFVPRPVYALPVDHRWTHSGSLTLLGDAAHLMPPVGVGVNLAMLDACELAQALADHDTLDAAVRAYEATMWPRSAEMSALVGGMATDLLDGAAPPVEVTQHA
ncbi:FAD-dependent oxidoreductase [Microlunatus flavus]|uniref:Flavin-dependent monooxygenase n=1 Tax=Microlunatus flavus TaxID=1036181 RepID=A0A1H9L6L4_9ACTN|nr:NAD(P)/FAD-dependent oxidoreductase [Microlunatus flavus]SER06643.1 2-polyprenyl-6-methoxyphenol hydroxylase [Microlunatus flavus]